MLIKKPIIISSIAALVFLFAALFTLKDYGVSWDEATHFQKGLAYVHYFLTGKKDYKDIAAGDGIRVSYYQSDRHDANYWMSLSGGHPPVNDILAGLANYVFFQKLGIVGDVESFHLFNILASSLLVFVVVYFACEYFSLLSGLIAGLVAGTYPYFWAESHFNIKDPPEAAFYAATLWAFLNSLRKKSIRWLILSFVFFILAIGTKFNAIFIPITVIVYFLVSRLFYPEEIKTLVNKISSRYKVALIVGPVVAALSLVALWPSLWQDVPQRVVAVINYYKSVGSGYNYQPDSYYIFSFNTYPLLWVLLATPPLTLALSIVGIFLALKKKYFTNSIGIFLIIWLLIPILRVSLPGTSIYGGGRQILEYMPAVAILAGVGAGGLVRKFSHLQPRILSVVLGGVLAISLFYPLIKYHPNENVYFNFLVGGLSGASLKDFPSWGNSFGNAYKQGIDWLNINAEHGAKVTLLQGEIPNAPPFWLRTDLNYAKENWSGIARGGEYIMELIFDDSGRSFFYAWEYVDKFLEPVYQLKADGVTILTIWKNDLDHTNTMYYMDERKYASDIKTSIENNLYVIDPGMEINLSRVLLKFTPDEGCYPITNSYLETSVDGNMWVREKDIIPFRQVAYLENLDRQKNEVIYMLAGRRARYVRFWFDNYLSCGLDNPKVELQVLCHISQSPNIACDL